MAYVSFLSFRCSFPWFFPLLYFSLKITSWFFLLLWLPPFLHTEFGNFSKDPLVEKSKTSEKVLGKPFFRAIPSVICILFFNLFFFPGCFLCCFLANGCTRAKSFA